MNRPAGLRSRFTGTDGRAAARLWASGARVVKCGDRDPDVANDGVALVGDIRQSVSCVLVRDGGHCRVGIAERTLVAEASDDKGFAVLCDPAGGSAMTGPTKWDRPPGTGWHHVRIVQVAQASTLTA